MSGSPPTASPVSIAAPPVSAAAPVPTPPVAVPAAAAAAAVAVGVPRLLEGAVRFLNSSPLWAKDHRMDMDRSHWVLSGIFKP